MKEFNIDHAKALYLRLCVIYGDKFVKTYHDNDFKSIWYNDWQDGLSGIDVSLIKNALEFCKKNLEWPPSIAEFRKICEKESGLPSPEECMYLIIRDDYEHPIVKKILEKVDRACFRKDTEVILLKKVKEAYQAALQDYRKSQITPQIASNSNVVPLSRLEQSNTGHNKEKASESKFLKDSHGRDSERDQPRRNGVRKAQEFIVF